MPKQAVSIADKVEAAKVGRLARSEARITLLVQRTVEIEQLPQPTAVSGRRDHSVEIFGPPVGKEHAGATETRDVWPCGDAPALELGRKSDVDHRHILATIRPPSCRLQPIA